MKAARYIEWAPGFGAKVKADVAHKELERIRKAGDGELSAVAVVEAARLKTSPLHPQIFDRSPKSAAVEYYKARARQMIASVIITFGEKPDIKTRAFSVVREEQSGVDSRRTAKFYGSTEEALKDPDHRQYVLASALREAAGWRKRYAALSELALIFNAIDKVAAKTL